MCQILAQMVGKMRRSKKSEEEQQELEIFLELCDFSGERKNGEAATQVVGPWGPQGSIGRGLGAGHG